jgi:hypothetical protein
MPIPAAIATAIKKMFLARLILAHHRAAAVPLTSRHENQW